MNKPAGRQEKADDSQSNWSDKSEDQISSDSKENDMSKDKQKFKQLKESKRRFLHELNEGPTQGDLKERMDMLVKKAESLANFLLTKHKYNG